MVQSKIQKSQQQAIANQIKNIDVRRKTVKMTRARVFVCQRKYI